MILEKITLTNFGIYKGEHTVDLKPKAKKPIILFGAYNGSGKTTFLEALQLALYGKAARTAGRGKMPYEDYLESLINRDTSKKHGAGLSLIFSSNQDGKQEKIQITRTWYQASNSIKEVCEVLRNGELDRVASERWGEFIEEFMPSQISELFFFDGEKIEGLADPLKSSAILKSGIYSLLGVNAIDNLLKSLNQIERKKALEISKEGDKNSIKNEEGLAKELSIKKEKLIFEIAQIETSIDKNNLELSKIENELKSSGADLLTNRHHLQEQQSILTEKNKSLNIQLIELAAEDTPLIFVQKLINELREIKEKSSGFNKKSLSLIDEEFKKASAKIKFLFPKEKQEHIDQLFNERIKEISDGLDEYAVEINTSEIPTTDELNELKQRIQNKLIELNEVNIELELINKNLLAVPAEDKVKTIVDKLNLTQSNKDRNLGKLEVLRADYDQVTYEQDKVSKTLSAKLMDIANQKTTEIVSQRIIKHSQKSRETLTNYKEALIQKHIVTLGQMITECFRLLHRKNKLELKFEIDPSDFNLNIKKNNGAIVSAKTLSAGERQLLSVAILWALAKSSGKILPTVIDTPLGRLDGPHRQKLIANYFPKASSQVLIFSTDEEITTEHYNSLKPFIASEYKINYSEETESSSFETGYFKEEVLND